VIEDIFVCSNMDTSGVEKAETHKALLVEEISARATARRVASTPHNPLLSADLVSAIVKGIRVVSIVLLVLQSTALRELLPQ